MCLLPSTCTCPLVPAALHLACPLPPASLSGQDPKDASPVIVAGKDEGEVDNDYFLIPVPVKDHEGPLENKFPLENRLLPQGGCHWAGRQWAGQGSKGGRQGGRGRALRAAAGIVFLGCCIAPLEGSADQVSSFTLRPPARPATPCPIPPPAHPPIAGTAELKAHLGSRRAAPFWARISDFHLLLYLARQPNLDLPEVGLLADAVRSKGEVPEGFQLIVQSMAGLM